MRNLTKFVTASLFGLLIASALSGGSASAQENPFSKNIFFWSQDEYDDPAGVELVTHLLTLGLFAAPLWTQKEERHLRIVAKVYSDARRALISGDGPAFLYAYKYLKSAVAPKSGASAGVRRRVRLYLSRLPDHFVPGFAYEGDDGTIAADPDPFIRLQLIRDRYAAEGNDSD